MKWMMSSGAFKIAVLYTIAGLLWIALSDNLLNLFIGTLDIRSLLFIGSVKGFGYVIITGYILYRLIWRHDKRLAESEKQYRSYFENNPTPMWIYNRRTLNFTNANNAAITKYGYTLEEFKTMTILDIRPKADIAKVYAVAKNLKSSYTDSGIWTHIKKSGMPLQVRIISHIITSGKEDHVMVMATEI